MAIDPAAFKAECETDPSGLGLAAPFAAGQNQGVVEILNLPRASIQLNPTYVALADVVGAIDPTDLAAAGATPSDQELQRQQWLEGGILKGEQIKNTPEVRSHFAATVGGTSLTALNDLTKAVDGSRAQQLWGEDATLDVARKAQALP
jgi:hypothetical protein